MPFCQILERLAVRNVEYDQRTACAPAVEEGEAIVSLLPRSVLHSRQTKMTLACKRTQRPREKERLLYATLKPKMRVRRSGGFTNARLFEIGSSDCLLFGNALMVWVFFVFSMEESFVDENVFFQWK